MPSVPRRVAVIGGGVTGLSAAYELATKATDVVLFERSEVFGGKIAESSIDGLNFPTGPDAFLARRHEVTALVEDLGLSTSLVSPEAGSARIFRNGQLHPLPPNVLGIPATSELTTSGLISAQGAERARNGVPDPADVQEADESVGSLVRRQLGDEVLEFLVDPLLGGINAGDSDRLSIVSGVPRIDALRRRDPLLLDAAAQALEEAAQAARDRGPRPVFRSIDGGLSRLVDALVETLRNSGRCELRAHTTATIEPMGSKWLVCGEEFDGVVSTIPAYANASLLSDVFPEASKLLSQIEYSSVALTVMTLAPGTLPVDTAISGVLVPRSIGLHVTAVSFASHKWPALAVGGQQMLRVSTGRRTDDRWTHLDNDQLVLQIEHDLSAIFETEVKSSNSVVTRWRRSLPQYDVGHSELIANIDTALAGASGLHLTGAWRDGLGLPACVGAGRRAADVLKP